MQIIKDENFKLNNSIVTLGKFDGSHIGHRALFAEAERIKHAADETLAAVIFTFDINPRQAVSHRKVSSLYTNAERMDTEEAYDIDFVFIWPFTKENMSMQPEAFVKSVLSEKLGVRHIIVGEDFRFGKDRKGDAALLFKLQKKYGFELHTVPKVKYKGEDVSSTRIKKELLSGNLEDANYMLGAPFSVSSEVVGGKHLGKSLGFPTINFNVPPGKVLPPDGVYATKTFAAGACFISMSNIGTRPTFEEGASRNIETNIFDFDEDIYGQPAKVEFYRYIRPEMHFENASDLVAEIKRNKEQIREYFSDGKYKQ